VIKYLVLGTRFDIYRIGAELVEDQPQDNFWVLVVHSFGRMELIVDPGADAPVVVVDPRAFVERL
jgi:hypothetical protein